MTAFISVFSFIQNAPLIRLLSALLAVHSLVLAVEPRSTSYGCTIYTVLLWASKYSIPDLFLSAGRIRYSGILQSHHTKFLPLVPHLLHQILQISDLSAHLNQALMVVCYPAGCSKTRRMSAAVLQTILDLNHENQILVAGGFDGINMLSYNRAASSKEEQIAILASPSI